MSQIHIGYTYTVFLVHMKFNFNWVFWVFLQINFFFFFFLMRILNQMRMFD